MRGKGKKLEKVFENPLFTDYTIKQITDSVKHISLQFLLKITINL